MDKRSLKISNALPPQSAFAIHLSLRSLRTLRPLRLTQTVRMLIDEQLSQHATHFARSTAFALRPVVSGETFSPRPRRERRAYQKIGKERATKAPVKRSARNYGSQRERGLNCKRAKMDYFENDESISFPSTSTMEFISFGRFAES